MRWLSLERCVERTIKKYAGLKSYFLSENFADARFQRLCIVFENPLTEVVCFFIMQASLSLQATLQKFTLQKLLSDGDITERECNDIFSAAQAYFKTALGYFLNLTDKVLQHANWINVQNRSERVLNFS